MSTIWRLAAVTGLGLVTLLASSGAADAAVGQGGGSDESSCDGFERVDTQVVLSGGPVVIDGCTRVDAVVVGDSDVLVDDDGRVDGAVVVGNGTAVIRGDVTGDVIVFRGRAVVESGAHVEGDVLSSQRPRVGDDARVDGDVRRVRFEAALDAFGIAARIAWWVAISVSTLVAGLVLTGAFGGLARRTVDAGRTTVGASIGAGVIAAIGVPLVSGLLVVTLVASPLGLAGLLAMVPLYLLGYVAGGLVLGNLILRERTGLVWAFLLGWLILRLVGVVPFLGGLLTTAATVYGLGALLVAAWRLTRPTPAPTGDADAEPAGVAPSPDASDAATPA